VLPTLPLEHVNVGPAVDSPPVDILYARNEKIFDVLALLDATDHPDGVVTAVLISRLPTSPKRRSPAVGLSNSGTVIADDVVSVFVPAPRNVIAITHTPA